MKTRNLGFVLLTSLLFGGALISRASADGAMEKPNAVLNAESWKITFPVQGSKGNALEFKNPEFSLFLERPEEFPQELGTYFHGAEEGLVFSTEYTGVTTSSKTKYSRTELREMSGSDENNWTIDQGGELRCRLKISELEGGANKLIFMQIHGKAPESKPLLKCVWEKGNIRLLTKAGDKLKDFKRKQDYAAVALNEWFTCAIKINREALIVEVNGKPVETYTAAEVLDYWPPRNTYYFKAGNYLQHDTPGAKSKVVFGSIDVSHPVPES